MRFIYLAYIVPGSVVLPMIAFGTRYRRASAAGGTLFGYLVVSSILNLVGILLATHHRSNLWVLHLYTAAEAVILLRFFYLILLRPVIRSIIRVMTVVFPLGCLADLIFLQPASVFNTYPRSIEALLFIGFCLAYWLGAGSEVGEASWTGNPLNWMISRMLLYFASDFLLFLFSNLLLSAALSGKHQVFWDMAWVTHASLVMLMYILFSIGFLKMNERGG